MKTAQTTMGAFLQPLRENEENRRTTRNACESRDNIELQGERKVTMNPSVETQIGGLSLPSILTFNVNSLSAYADARDKKAIARKVWIRKFLTREGKNTDFILLQETKLYKNEKEYLQDAFPGAQIFYNNHPDNSDGPSTNRASTATIVSERVRRHYTATQCKLSRINQGYSMCIDLKPKNASTHRPYRVVNVYLDSGSEQVRSRMVKSLGVLDNRRQSFVAGDFNFTLTPKDSTTGRKCGGELFKEWGKLSEHLQLKEVQQEEHTFFRIARDKPTSSRIDRIYHSLTEGEMALTGIACTIRERPQWGRRRTGPPQDHLPVKLQFITDDGPKKRAYPHIPRHITSDPNFRSLFLQSWFHETVPSEDPMKKWKQLNNTIHKAAKAYFMFTKPKANAVA